MSESTCTRRPLRLPSRSDAMSTYWIWSRPWCALISDSLRVSVHLIGVSTRPATPRGGIPTAGGRRAAAQPPPPAPQQGEYLRRGDLQLAPEASTDVGGDDPQLVLGNAGARRGHQPQDV